MKRILLALTLLLVPTLAFGQCNGVFPAHTLCGNNTGSPAIPGQFPASAITGVLPNPVRAGDIIYWNGSAWTTLAGNNSGTVALNENASGVPSWVTAVTGTVTSVVITAGAGISATGTCTITATGTCTVAANLSTFTNSLGGDVALNNTANYFDGPSVAQGSTGTWFVSGTVSLGDSVSASFQCKLWDGTTVIASSQVPNSSAGVVTTLSLSGYLASPAGNLRISCKDITATTGALKFNTTGNSKDSTISAVRIQ
jgi:hypothetical protein